MSSYPVVNLCRGIRLDRVNLVRLAVGMHGNTRVWTSTDAQEILASIQALKGPTVDRDNVSPNSWDWDRNKANPRYDAPIGSFLVQEFSHIEGAPIPYETYTQVWAWDLGETDDGTDIGTPIVSIREYHSAPLPHTESHENYFKIPRDDFMAVFNHALATPSSPPEYTLAEILVMFAAYLRKQWSRT